jgi:hypothetical protein
MKKLTIALAVVALSVAVWAVRAPQVRSSPSCGAQTDPASGGAGDLLLAVSGPPERAVAVGIHYVGGDGHTLVLQRSNGAWQAVHVPVDGHKVLVQLQDATTDGATTWAVGTYRNDEPVAGTLRDGRWRWTEPVDPGPLEDEFLGVVTTPDGTVWAVGKHETSDRNYQPLIERYDGRAWTVVPSPAVDGSAVLKDVAFAPGGTLWAVGWVVGHGGVTIPLVERWDGSAWTRVPAPGQGQLSGVAIVADRWPMAVGWRSTRAGDEIVSLGAPGSGVWRTLHGDGAPGRLTAIASGQGMVAVGLRDDGTGLPTPLAVSYQDGWQPMDLGATSVAPGGGQLLGLTGEAGDFLGVGIAGTDTGFGSLFVTGACSA